MMKFRASSGARKLEKIRFVHIIVKVNWRYCIIANLKVPELCANFKIESNARYLRRSGTVLAGSKNSRDLSEITNFLKRTPWRARIYGSLRRVLQCKERPTSAFLALVITTLEKEGEKERKKLCIITKRYNSGPDGLYGSRVYYKCKCILLVIFYSDDDRGRRGGRDWRKGKRKREGEAGRGLILTTAGRRCLQEERQSNEGK